MAENNQEEAFVNFEQAFHLLHDNKTPNQHYPLRQVSLFKPYYEAFYDSFSDAEKNLFLLWCIEMQKTIHSYLSRQSMQQRHDDRSTRDLQKTERELEKIRRKIVASDNA